MDHILTRLGVTQPFAGQALDPANKNLTAWMARVLARATAPFDGPMPVQGEHDSHVAVPPR